MVQPPHGYPQSQKEWKECCILGPRGAWPPTGSGPHGPGRDEHVPRCITRRECICSTALHSCAKYFQTVLSGMSRFCFLKYYGGEDRQAWVTATTWSCPCPAPAVTGARHGVGCQATEQIVHQERLEQRLPLPICTLAQTTLHGLVCRHPVLTSPWWEQAQPPVGILDGFAEWMPGLHPEGCSQSPFLGHFLDTCPPPPTARWGAPCRTELAWSISAPSPSPAQNPGTQCLVVKSQWPHPQAPENLRAHDG